jgi:hypothetical protein
MLSELNPFGISQSGQERKCNIRSKGLLSPDKAYGLCPGERKFNAEAPSLQDSHAIHNCKSSLAIIPPTVS